MATLYLKLPDGESECFPFSVLSSTRTFKIAIEKKCGIPYELLRVSFADVLLDDTKSLVNQGVSSGSMIDVQVDMWWQKLVVLSMKGSTNTLARRVSIPMQQIGETNRIFVILFICATRGLPQGVVSLLSTYKNFDLEATTKVTGRTLFHAAVTSGSLKCVEQLKKHAGLSFERLLYVKDKSGASSLDELSTRDNRMLHYINKFLSSPLSVEQVENKKNIEQANTYIIETENNDICKYEGDKEHTTSQNHENNEKQKTTIAENLPILGRTKETQNINCEVKKVFTEHTVASMATIIVEHAENNNKTVRVGEAKILREEIEARLPFLQQPKEATAVPTYSPRPVRKTSKSNASISPVISETPKKPHPPTHEKKRPVAGILKESNLRKFSAASRPRHPNALLAPTKISTKRPNLEPPATPTKLLSPHTARKNEQSNQNGESSSSSEKKVRRISLIRSPRPLSPCPPENSSETDDRSDRSTGGESQIIEIDKDRIEKPWNSWIKAVTVDADEERDTDSDMTEPSEKSIELSNRLQTPSTTQESARKISFDQWVLQKARQELEMSNTQNHLRESPENQAEIKKQNGKTFEQWKQEKDEYERHLMDQAPKEDKLGKTNQRKKSFKQAKTYEEWQKETEAKKMQEMEIKKKQQVLEKENLQTEKARRRKESTAKYQQWLLEKEKLAFEKNMQELQTTRSLTKKKGT